MTVWLLAYPSRHGGGCWEKERESEGAFYLRAAALYCSRTDIRGLHVPSARSSASLKRNQPSTLAHTTKDILACISTSFLWREGVFKTLSKHFQLRVIWWEKNVTDLLNLLITHYMFQHISNQKGVKGGEKLHWVHSDLPDLSGADWFTAVSEIKEAHTHLEKQDENSKQTWKIILHQANFGWGFTSAAGRFILLMFLYLIWRRKSICSFCDCSRLLLSDYTSRDEM